MILIMWVDVSGFILGFAVGWIFYFLTVLLIMKKTTDKVKMETIKKAKCKLAYVLLSTLGFGLICVFVTNPVARYETMILFSICLSIGWVDGMIRKIPNEWLLALIVCKISFLFIDWQLSFLVQGLIGLAAGFVLFMLPSFLGIPIGAGDIKYAAVVGFYFGAYGFIQVVLVMALGLFLYLLYLLITKKGSLKTAAAIGPYISFGVMCTVLFPLL